MLNILTNCKINNDLSCLPEGVKIKNCQKLVCNLYDKEKYVAHIRTLKQTLNYGLVLKKVHRIIKFKQKAWLKPYINMNTKLRTEAKPNYHTAKWFLENLLVIEINKVKINQPICLGLLVL